MNCVIVIIDFDHGCFPGHGLHNFFSPQRLQGTKERRKNEAVFAVNEEIGWIFIFVFLPRGDKKEQVKRFFLPQRPEGRKEISHEIIWSTLFRERNSCNSQKNP
jgi:hypothetical protein